MKDYTCLYREELDINSAWSCNWDVFISAFEPCERVRDVFDKAPAKTKYWVVHNEYHFSAEDIPTGAFQSASSNEADFILDLFDNVLAKHDLNSELLCVDITGFMRPHLMFLMKLLFARGVTRFDVVYTEPKHYAEREKTTFSDTAVTTVRQVAGFEGVVNNDTSKDVLVIGAGYESHLIEEVADDKESAERIVLFGFPSLRADMYQQNRLKVHEASDSIGETPTGKLFAPANDPFVTATVLSELLAKREGSQSITNLYLAPLATKAQALGFVLYYINECENRAASIIYPFSESYSPDASRGISRVWRYTVERLI